MQAAPDCRDAQFDEVQEDPMNPGLPLVDYNHLTMPRTTLCNA
jgi:hypothetical protein